MENCANLSILADYYIDAEEYWDIHSLGDMGNDPEPIRRLFRALETNTRVKCIELCLAPALMKESDVALFANSLEMNTSLDALYLMVRNSDEQAQYYEKMLGKILMALSTRKKSLRTLIISGSSCNLEPSKEILVNLVRNNPELRNLRLSCNLSEESVIKILEQIDESCKNLQYIDISIDVGPNALYALATVAGKSRTLQTLDFSSSIEDVEWSSPEVLDRVAELLGTENKVLRYVNIPCTSDFKIVEENWKKKPDSTDQIIMNKYLAEKEYEEWLDRVISQEANFDLTKFSVDLMFAILVYTGEFDTIRGFFQTNKYWNGAAKKYNFWKHMANSFLPAIDPDVLAHTDTFYANNLASYGAKKANFWELLLSHSLHYCGSSWKSYFSTLNHIDKYSQRLPFPHPAPSTYLHDQLIIAISRRWPSISSHVEMIRINDAKHSYHHIDLPYCWIQIAFGYNNLYHIILQTFGNTRITGFFFVCDNTQSFFNDPFQYIQVPLEYFTADSIEEALVKMKRMMDVYAAAMGRKYEFISKRPILRDTLIKAKDTHTSHRQDITRLIDQIVTNIMDRFDVTATDAGKIVDLIEKTTKRLREQPIFCANELIDRKHVLPDRYNVHLQYPRDVLHDISFYAHNRTGDWGKPIQKVVQQSKQKKKKTISLKATLSKLTRVVLNFVVMPVLKTLWPRSSAEIDKGYSGSSEKRFDETIISYYMNCHERPSNVTITESHPRCWPLSALVIAKQIVVKLGQLVAHLVGVALKRKNNIAFDINKLLEYLSVYDLIPQKHLDGLKVAIEDLLREI